MIDFLKYRLVYGAISLIMIGVSFYAIVAYGFPLSIDFTGGSQYELSAKQLNEKTIATLLSKDTKIQGVSISNLGKNSWLVKSAPVTEKQLKTVIGKQDIQIDRLETVGPSIGKETIRKTLIAILVAAAGILLYMSYSFKRFNHGIAAILAMVHDITILIGTYLLICHFFGAEVDTLFVTALLTTLSFSVHDTIVVFDKIREYQRSTSWPMYEIANKALTQTMIRSLNNSLTIVLMLVPMVLFSGEMVRYFAVALLIGTIVGTYSSPFVATPLLYLMDSKKRK